VRRFNAIRGHQAAQGREISRCLKELRLLRREPLVYEGEPETAVRNEPDRPTPESAIVANDDGPRHGMEPCSVGVDKESQNEPDEPVELDAATPTAREQAVRDWAEAHRRRTEAERAYAAPAEPAPVGRRWPGRELSRGGISGR
jgi:hypothetical protein